MARPRHPRHRKRSDIAALFILTRSQKNMDACRPSYEDRYVDSFWKPAKTKGKADMTRKMKLSQTMITQLRIVRDCAGTWCHISDCPRLTIDALVRRGLVVCDEDTYWNVRLTQAGRDVLADLNTQAMERLAHYSTDELEVALQNAQTALEDGALEDHETRSQLAEHAKRLRAVIFSRSDRTISA